MEHAASRRPRLNPIPLAGLALVGLALVAVDALPVWPGLVHFVALPPLDLIADLRALLALAPGVPSFVVLLAVMVVVRSAVLALVLGGLTRQRFYFALRFYLMVLPFAAVSAATTYGSQAMLFYGLFWVGLVVALGMIIGFGSIPWLGAPRIRSGFREAARHGFRLGTIGAYLALLVGLAALADVAGTVVTMLAVPASAALTWVTAQALYRDPGFRVARRVVGVVPFAAVAALLAIALTGPDSPPRGPTPEQPRDGSIMLMSGIDSRSGSGAMLEIDPNVLGYTCDQAYYFSYAGPGDGQPQADAMCEIDHGAEYTAEDTMRSRDEIVPFLEDYSAAMPTPAVLTGHSQGAWMVWEAAAEDRLPGADAIVLVGPFTANPVSYPEGGEPAAGRVGRMLLSVFANVARPGGTTAFEPDSPLGREWLGDPVAVERTLARPLPDGIRALSVPSVFDLPIMSGSADVGGAVDACPVPVIHPNLPFATEFRDALTRFLDGDDQPACPVWREAVGPALRSFSAPPTT